MAAANRRPIQLVVCGAAGRMGRRIIALACEDPRFRVVGAVEAAGHAALGRDAGEVAGVARLGVAIAPDTTALATNAATKRGSGASAATAAKRRSTSDKPRAGKASAVSSSAGAAVALGPDTVVVDFTSAEASLDHLAAAARAGAPIVLGSTGLSPAQRKQAERIAAGMPTLIAPNMSVGVNVLLSLVEDAVARLGPAFDCEIFEVHHGRKKDAPSGTALALAEAAARAAGRDPAKTIRAERHGMVGERPVEEIGVFGLRGGDAVGDHTVMLLGTGERIELVHRAASRDCLASGALRAAAWIHDKPAGLYSMRDVILGKRR
jgi:4-hydroxy-tetrahydrodipicolinate reductase